jgi:DNA-binding protein
MSNFNNAIAFVMTKATDEELSQIVQALKMRRQQLTKANVRSIKIGDKVEFSAPKCGRIEGKVTAVKIKFISVSTKYGNYRVPASMIKLLEAA